MQKEHDVAIVGAGNIGQALAVRLVTCGANVTLTVRSEMARERLLAHPTLVSTNIEVGNEAAKDASITILAVKPVNLPEIYADLGGKMSQNCLVISVVAGASVSALATGLDFQQVVRAMPNLASEFGESVTVWYGHDEIGDRMDQIVAFLSQLGKEFRADKEKDVDFATALFGSGPAFVYYFMEAMVEGGMLIGFPKNRLRELMVQMVRGAVVSAEQRPNEHLAQLRDDISSTGGTTVEGIRVLDKYCVRAAIKEVIAATAEKALHLMNGKK
ncbi:NAD(P)-binding domain-containing protein [Patescibacteria group bacterium]|nr:NAD(P)-binding domain-containing protein [Patescibacteria group bacterium]MBU1612986.1 NAD(P)-binding domain-containing protein [Patescibacteria group bacterium]